MQAADRPVMIARELRFKDLRGAQIVNLPSPRRRRWARVRAGVAWGCAIGTGFLAYGAPLYWILVVILVLSGFGWLAEARKISAQLRAPQVASFDQPTAWEEGGETAVEGIANVVLSGGGGLLETGAGLATRFTDRLWRRRKPQRLAPWQPAVAAALLPRESPIVSCRALLTPYGPRRRVLLVLTFWLTWPWLVKSGLLTLTDQRLLFHHRSRLRRGRVPTLHIATRLNELEVLEWFQGGRLEPRSQVLLVRGPDRRPARFTIDRVWAQEAQWVFDLVASSSERPPAVLAARWSLAGD